MPDRMEMVVNGKRQTALPDTPDFASRTSPAEGFFMEATRLSSFELPDHWIPFYAVGLQFVRGTGKRFFSQDGRRHEDAFHTDDMFVIAPQEIRRYRCEVVEGKLSMISIEPMVLQEMVAGPPRNPFELTRAWYGRDPALKDLVLKLQEDAIAGHPTGALLREAICTKLAEELIHRYSLGKSRLDRYKGGLSGAQLRRALGYIEEYLALDLNGRNISSVAGLSKYHFGKAFRQSTGMTLHGYVLARRMRRSQELLAKSDLPLAAVAVAAGFSNQSHFTSVFSTRMGIAPGSYRQAMRRRVSVAFRANDGLFGQ